MKKIIPVLLGGIIITFAASSKLTAQSYEKGVAFASLKNNPALAAYVSESTAADKSASTSTLESLKAAKAELKASEASLKALKASSKASENFKKSFKDAPEASWSKGENTIVASFQKDEVKTNVVYDKKGNLIHSLSYFPADKTPGDIRTIVEDAYPNGDITLAIQVKENGMEFYIVQLEDKRTYKQVAVYEGATNLIKEYNKAR